MLNLASSPSPDDARALREAATRALTGCQRDVNFLRLLERPVPATRWSLMLIGLLFAAGFAVSYLYIRPRLDGQVDGIYPMIVFGAKINVAISDGAWWRLLTSATLHGSLLHLAFNAYGLYLLGSIGERLLGTPRFITVLGLSALGGAAASYLFNDALSVGASGAIFGLLGATMVFGFKHRARLPAQIARALSTGMVPWLLLSLALGLTPMPIDNAAHLGGLVTGSALALGLGSPLTGVQRPLAQRALLVTAAALIVATALSLGLMTQMAARCLSSAESWQACRALVPVE